MDLISVSLICSEFKIAFDKIIVCFASSPLIQTFPFIPKSETKFQSYQQHIQRT
jgi:hypothetical protein